MGVRERKERERQQRRFDILESARAAFAKYGLEQTSMDRIAQEAELAKGTLYLYFKNRDELLMALLVHDFSQLIDEIEATIALRETPQEQLIAIPGCFYEFSCNNEVFYKMITHLNMQALVAKQDDSEHLEHFREVNLRMMSLITGVVRRGISQGVFHLTQPVEMAVMEMMLAIDGTMVILSNGMMPPLMPLQDFKIILHNLSCMFIRSLESPKSPECASYLFGDRTRPLPSTVIS